MLALQEWEMVKAGQMKLTIIAEAILLIGCQ